jgi:hypothetical protein
MPDLIVTAFSVDGDKTVPPQLSPQNFVSFEQGYTTDYEEPLNAGNPNAKPVERPIQNYLFYVTTDNISFLQQHGYCIWYNTMPGGYGVNDKVVRQNNDGSWLPFRSLVSSNITDPLVNSASWEFDYSVTAINAAIPMPSGGSIGASTPLITSSIDLNFVSIGTFEIVTDAVAQSCSNIPAQIGSTAQAGLLETITWTFNSVNYSVQRYTTRTGTTASRGSINGTWSPWVLSASSYGRCDGVLNYNATATLTASAGGNVVIWSGAASGSLTMPIKSSLITNQFIWFYNKGATSITISTQGSDILNAEGVNLTSLILQPGDSMQVVSPSVANTYYIIGGTILLSYSTTRGTLAPLGDNSLRLATTSFVQRDSVNTVYPVGIAIFFAQNKNPNSLFPGTSWVYTGENKTIRTGLQNGSDVNTSGGSDTQSLNSSNLPPHNHTGSGTTSGENVAHVHGVSAHIGIVGTLTDLGNVGADNTNSYPTAVIDQTINVSTGSESTGHEHTYSFTTSSTGSSSPFSVVNSYIKLMCWYRSA